MLVFGGVAKYKCQKCKKIFFIKLWEGGAINARARLPYGIKCPQCGSEDVKSGLLSRLLY